MIIGFTGPQCAGKTTIATQLCSYLTNCNFDVVFQPEQVLPKDLTDITSKELELVQCMTLNHHIKPLLNHAYNTKLKRILVTDRTIIDAYVYTNFFAKQQTLPEELLRYSGYLVRKLVPYYSVIFHCDIENIDLVDDGIRSTDNTFRTDISVEFINYLKCNNKFLNNNNVRILSLRGPLEQRVQKAIQFFEEIKFQGFKQLYAK